MAWSGCTHLLSATPEAVPGRLAAVEPCTSTWSFLRPWRYVPTPEGVDAVEVSAPSRKKSASARNCVRIAGPDTSSRSGVDTNALTSAALAPEGAGAIRFAHRRIESDGFATACGVAVTLLYVHPFGSRHGSRHSVAATWTAPRISTPKGTVPSFNCSPFPVRSLPEGCTFRYIASVLAAFLGGQFGRSSLPTPMPVSKGASVALASSACASRLKRRGLSGLAHLEHPGPTV